MKTYRVVPFLPNISERQASKRGAKLIAEQMQAAINRGAEQGWDSDHYVGIEVTVHSGCLGIPLGSRKDVYRMLVFSRNA